MRVRKVNDKQTSLSNGIRVFVYPEHKEWLSSLVIIGYAKLCLPYANIS